MRDWLVYFSRRVLPMSAPVLPSQPRAEPTRQDYPSTAAMKAAVELEIMKCIGHVQTVGIGQLIQKVVDVESATLKARIQELDRLLAEAADELNASPRMRAMDLGHRITMYRSAQQKAEKASAGNGEVGNEKA